MKTTTTNRTLNGVPVDRLESTVKAIEQAPTLARFTFRAGNRWIDGGLNRSTIQGFHGAGQEDASRSKPFVIDNDEPDVLLGTDQAPNPAEYVLHALAGCLTTNLAYQGAARGIHIEEIESRLEGTLDLRGMLGLSDQVRQGFESIHVVFRVKSDASEESLRELFELCQRRSPVLDIVSNPVPVSLVLES
jgi:uncharacterized OsmC-like protein